MILDLQDAILEGFKLALSTLGSLFTMENLITVAPVLLLTVFMIVIFAVLGFASEMVRSFFRTGIGQLVLLIGLGVVAANVWIF